MFKIIPLSFLIIGILLIGQVSLPMISFQIWEGVLAKNSLPLTSPQTSAILGVSIENTEDNFPQFVSNTTRLSAASYPHFTVSVPSIKVKDEIVFVDNNDLSLGLIHLPGSSLPGEKGNVFISGHSVLPIFSKSKTARFANLPHIKIGDEITLSALGTKFTYKVTDIKIVRPDEVSVIAPPDNIGRYVTLMTCVPPGLNTKRLVVLGKLI